MIARFGVDTIADPTPIAVQIAASSITYTPHDKADPDAGAHGFVSFFGGYLGRNLSAHAIDACFAAGLDVFSIYERPYPAPINAAYFTRAQGEQDGADAVAKARAVKQPSDAAVYFAIDTDPATMGQPAIVEYFRGVADGMIDAFPIGCYGAGCALDWLRAAGLIAYLWQPSMSWAYGGNASSHPFAHLRQYKGNVKLYAGSTLFDFNFAPTGHFGGWGMRRDGDDALADTDPAPPPLIMPSALRPPDWSPQFSATTATNGLVPPHEV